ncbi:translation initiation factor IF-2-like [Falco biarmicus]|uniref:translation initiation factor IF-2-like n=1 Tax=Falco biarmicus TaxID=345155 RepID=UPI0024BCEAC3|nr:translation initiation factor IF-2-like [Falco biarmicus]
MVGASLSQALPRSHFPAAPQPLSSGSTGGDGALPAALSIPCRRGRAKGPAPCPQELRGPPGAASGQEALHASERAASPQAAASPVRAPVGKAGSRRLLTRVRLMLQAEKRLHGDPSPGSSRTAARSHGSNWVLCVLPWGAERPEQPCKLRLPVSRGATTAAPSSAPASAAAGAPPADTKASNREHRAGSCRSSVPASLQPEQPYPRPVSAWRAVQKVTSLGSCVCVCQPGTAPADGRGSRRGGGGCQAARLSEASGPRSPAPCPHPPLRTAGAAGQAARSGAAAPGPDPGGLRPPLTQQLSTRIHLPRPHGCVPPRPLPRQPAAHSVPGATGHLAARCPV